MFLFSRSSTFRILEACYGLFRINTLLEAERLLEWRLLIEGVFIEKKNHKKGGVYSRGRLIRSLTMSILSYQKNIFMKNLKI